MEVHQAQDHRVGEGGVAQARGEGVAAERVHRARPALLAQRDPSPGKFASIDDFIRAESLQVVAFLLGPAGGGDDAIAELVEERDRDRAHPTGSTGHQHIAFIRCDSLLF